MVSDDVYEALQVSGGVEMGLFEKVFGSSNENLKELFQCFSLQGKDVLTVLASSDQFFYSVYFGAKKVDTFDHNPLTKYYYYLRRWMILYRHLYYLPKKAFQDRSYLDDLMFDIHPETEEEEQAHLFWKLYLKEATPKIHEGLYCSELSNSKNRIMDKDLLCERLLKIHPTFYAFDLFEDIFSSKTYDIVIASNILEYGRTTLRFTKCRDNLKTLLRPGGKVINSRFTSSQVSKYFDKEKEIFLSDFDFSEFVFEKKSIFFMKEPLGYSYQKKYKMSTKNS